MYGFLQCAKWKFVCPTWLYRRAKLSTVCARHKTPSMRPVSASSSHYRAAHSPSSARVNFSATFD